MIKTVIFYLPVLLICFFVSCGSSLPEADVILINGNIYTVDENMPKAQALAISGFNIMTVGTNEQISKLTGQGTTVMDLKGRTVIPGLNEGHAHFKSYGQSLTRLALADAKNWQEIINRVAVAAANAPSGTWILGRGWHQDKWIPRAAPAINGYPVHDLLSKISPSNPVYLTHASGHAIIANQSAMAMAGITKNTPDPAGGTILHKDSGDPSGVFLENADMLITSKYIESQKQLTSEEKNQIAERELLLANQSCLENGITTFQDAGAGMDEIDFYKKLIDSGKLDVRLWVMLENGNKKLKESITKYRIIGYGDNKLTVRSIKKYIDGALGSHGAWLFEPYLDRPQSSGLNTTSMEELLETANIAAQNGFQMCIHSIGDRGNRETLDLYQNIFKKYPEITDWRWRIEHAQHLHPDDIPRFKSLGVIAAMQTVHCTSDGPWIPDRIGAERSREGAYVWRDLISSGAVIANGTDAPVERIDPFENFYAAVTRKMANGDSFYPGQAMTRQEALRSYTLNPAFAAFEDEIKGSITKGKLADIVVLSQDIMTVPEEQIPATKVMYTIIGGEIVYRAAE